MAGDPAPFTALLGRPLKKPLAVEDRGYKTPCWIWQMAKMRKGYGILRREGRTLSAHRSAYTVFVGAIPTGLTIDHLCRQPSCVRPDHLEPVPIAVNCQRGERAKLSTELVVEIRRRYRDEPILQAELARSYGVTPKVINGVIRGTRWPDSNYSPPAHRRRQRGAV